METQPQPSPINDAPRLAADTLLVLDKLGVRYTLEECWQITDRAEELLGEEVRRG
jgi:hypothetical protein|tara:strand:+ start:516 stop:680 length:165 start_codon:yes stop_codon:yes gene_type:complete